MWLVESILPGINWSLSGVIDQFTGLLPVTRFRFLPSTNIHGIPLLVTPVVGAGVLGVTQCETLWFTHDLRIISLSLQRRFCFSFYDCWREGCEADILLHWLKKTYQRLECVSSETSFNRYLVDPASSHMLVSKTKPCMSMHKPNMVKPRMAHYNSHSLLDLRFLLGYLW